MSSHSNDKKDTSVSVAQRKNSDESVDDALKSPRTARFAEATSVDSPIEPSAASQAPFSSRGMTSYYQAQMQPGDIGFGYINDRRSAQNMPHVEMPLTPMQPMSPLKSAMKSPGAKSTRFEVAMKSPTFLDEELKSPTWREEKLLERREEFTDKQQAGDLKVKVRVRMAKMILRMTNFSCSLIVVAMLTSTITVFNASINLPPRNTLPPWAPGTPRWPQITVLCIAVISLFASIVIMIAYCRGTRRIANKWQTYYSILAVTSFGLSIILWAIGAGVLQHSKNVGDGKDMWGWSCKDNTRRAIFQQDVDYALLCRLQNWSLVCCIIEIVVEVITILVYGIVFYRFWSKRQLRNTMVARDKARSQLYQSMARSTPQTPAPFSPGHPLSPREGGYNPMFSPSFGGAASGTQSGQTASASTAPKSSTFVLQAPPKKVNSPTVASPSSPSSGGFDDPRPPRTPAKDSPRQGFSLQSNPVAYASAAPGEQQYGEVPIPGAYASPLASPGAQQQFQGMR